ncbi:prolyl oligopeptidase family serine peptidase [Simiduia sp. 21SJ11W-1]|uniref:prolyl oligopeptidase family serine peptidase n=1 Tax=Simiduia sp. 21SJ11W-1 TaxID=2909669 RepID=UPI0020A21F59|nr:prolyl oligopeptidase family serine peptidase [Simiduia sp. 21SJ11W-1]UTA49206.1 prolyl oligopeptidase family serine peptidase [Simiduia sp. 21SJ11W-1]
MRLLLWLCSAALLATACSKSPDDYQWLEDVEGSAALAWVEAANSETDARLASSALYETLYNQALEVLSNPERLPDITQKGDYLYNLWQDTENPRGLYRRTPAADFASGNFTWETVLDLDELSKTERVQWVLKGMNCLAPEYQRCLVSLSEGGGDTIEVREFNAQTLNFIAGGFTLPPAKSNVDWIDENHVFVGTDFGADSLTDSGYPREVRIWRRGTPLANAELVHTAQKSSVSASGNLYKDGNHQVKLIREATSFWESRHYLLTDGKLAELKIPATAIVKDLVKNELLFSLKADWQFNGRTFKQGAVLLARPQILITPEKSAAHDIVELIEPSADFVVEEIYATPRGILAVGLADVTSQARLYQKRAGNWQWAAIELPTAGAISIETINHKNGDFFARYESFLTPPRLYHVTSSAPPKLALSQPATFDASGFMVEQFKVASSDGTLIPYFVVRPKSLTFDGSAPTHIFSYGGFRVSLTPSYSGSYEDLNGAYGKLWLERGGVFVLANIRGGGEYGPAWHSAVLKENRTKAYEDFEAIAEDLIVRNITSAKHIGIEGRSNGGLLVGATMVRRPDLYGAVICGVPLLDMQRYHQLLAGASWMAEYGNPDIEQEWGWIKQYSPFQNVKADAHYPPVLFYTSTKDDRVHPGHARKMAARMKAMGHAVEYYENREGGHGGSSTKDQLAKRVALGYTHLWTELSDQNTNSTQQ